jgi:hypothetical protein
MLEVSQFPYLLPCLFLEFAFGRISPMLKKYLDYNYSLLSDIIIEDLFSTYYEKDEVAFIIVILMDGHIFNKIKF